MTTLLVSPRDAFSSAWKNKELILALTQREIIGRYQGSYLGILWSFFNPVLMLFVYTFVFSVIFGARWSSQSDSKSEFALVLFSGLIIFNIFAECANRAPGLILNNSNYVKKVVFPLEILPWVSLGSALFHATISFSVWLITYLFVVGPPPITTPLVAVTVLPLIFFVLGFSWAFSALGVYLRDLAQITSVITSILMFLSPIFYPTTAIPEEYRSLLRLNPLTEAIEQGRDVLLWGRIPDLTLFLSCLGGSLLVAYLGFLFFQKTRKGFADVL